MIKVFFYVLLSLSLIVIQTSLLPSISLFYHCFDLLLIVVLFFSLMFSHTSMIVSVIFIGFCMDSISGAPLGIYTISYIWIFILVQFLKRFVHRGNFIFLPCISAISVIMENSFLFFSFFIRYGRDAISIQDLIVAGEQSLWAFFVISICVVAIHGAHGVCDRLDTKGFI
ncbi:MAG: rod shape-determining protein MreD [Desulfamplus sp.]|nr:rod shape-determining protein MreD [Desulfamplus sp.]